MLHDDPVPPSCTVERKKEKQMILFLTGLDSSDFLQTLSPDEMLRGRKEQSLWGFLSFKSVFYKNRKLSRTELFQKGTRSKADKHVSNSHTALILTENTQQDMILATYPWKKSGRCHQGYCTFEVD